MTQYSTYVVKGVRSPRKVNKPRKSERCKEVLEKTYGSDFTALQGKVAMITGASNGLGLENARQLGGVSNFSRLLASKDLTG